MMSQNYNTGQPLVSDTPDDGASFGTLTPVASASSTTAATVAAALVSTTSSTATTTSKAKTLKPAHKPTAFSLKPIARPKTLHAGAATVRKV
jgi:hypothetical protein